MSHHHLTIEERACIAVYYKEKRSVTEIANLLQRNKSTISRELQRNPSRDEGYNAVGAQRKYNKRRKLCIRKIRLKTEEDLYELICADLEKYWSPEQIVNTLPEGYNICICTIYRAINAKLFPKEICRKLRRYGKQLKHKKRKGICYDFSKVRKFSERPDEILTRQEVGHWELDTVVLRNECSCHIATMVERKSRLLLVKRIENKKATTMADVVIETLKQLPKSMRKTLTVDRGLEFADWERMERELDVEVYFCDPYKPYQRGSNENTNGLVRQFFPRRCILPPVSEEDIKLMELLINNRPRKCLSWKSPYQIFNCCI